MSDHRVFVDTGGFFALLVSNDDYHSRALSFVKGLRSKATKLVTTDYVLDETFTLLKSRKVGQLVSQLHNILQHSSYIQVEWIDSDRFDVGLGFFLRHKDHRYSFTDCVSFTIMKELQITKCLTADQHFNEAGFQVLL